MTLEMIQQMNERTKVQWEQNAEILENGRTISTDTLKKQQNKSSNKNVPGLITRNPNEIIIPLPSYSYGASRRAIFAFGRITAPQARTNTAEHVRQIMPDTAQDPWDTVEETSETTDQHFQEHTFQNDENPNANDCV